METASSVPEQGLGLGGLDWTVPALVGTVDTQATVTLFPDPKVVNVGGEICIKLQ